MAPALRMATRSRRLRWCLGSLLIALGCTFAGNAAKTAAGLAFAASASVFESYLAKLALSLSPGLAVAGGAYALYRSKESQPKPMWYLSTALLAMVALAVPLVMPELPAKEVVPEIKLKSGEERLMPNGKFVLVSDPRPGSGPAQEGWQQALWQEMAEAISKGEEQVVMVFSRPGCPWCERLHPVLQNAIKRRADSLAAASNATEDQAPLLRAPLRVFIYDAMEFGPIMRRFGVEGFPTMFFFGPPGSRPVVVPGYLGDKDFDTMATQAATTMPEPPKERRERKGFFR